MSWPSVPGRNFLVEGSTNLDDWQDIESSFPAASAGTTTTLAVDLDVETARYFVRISLLPR